MGRQGKNNVVDMTSKRKKSKLDNSPTLLEVADGISAAIADKDPKELATKVAKNSREAAKNISDFVSENRVSIMGALVFGVVGGILTHGFNKSLGEED